MKSTGPETFSEGTLGRNIILLVHCAQQKFKSLQQKLEPVKAEVDVMVGLSSFRAHKSGPEPGI